MKNQIILIAGPWSSGSSALTGFISKLGIPAPGPYVYCNDPRTPLTYELESFREVIIQSAPDEALGLIQKPDVVIEKLSYFRDIVLPNILEADGISTNSPILLKHPSSAFMLDEFFQVFNTAKMIVSIRPLEDIEATRLRRKWFNTYGSLGAQAIYGRIFTHIIKADTPCHLVKYNELLSQPLSLVDPLSKFIGINPSKQQIQQAYDYVQFRNK